MTGLILHRSDDASALAAELASRLGGVRTDPFATDLVVTPHAHLRRWLTNELAHRLGSPGEGICAGVDFVTPARLLRDLGEPLALWRARHLTWRLLAVIETRSDVAELAQLRRHLGNSRDGYRVARRIARLFERYLEWRPDLIARWRAGDDCDEQGRPLGVDGWQPVLWRLLAAEADPLAERDAFLTDLRQRPQRLALPGSVSFVQPDPLSPWWVQILSALAEHRDVHVSLRQVTAASWPAPLPDDPAARLSAFECGAQRGLLPLARDELLAGTVQPPGTLGWLQSRLTGRQEPPPAPDGSVQVHAGHGLERQVEILRDAITGLLASDRSLEPRHIVVGCANLAAAAPLVTAAFRLPSEVPGRHPANDFRVQVADRSSADTNPLLGIIVRLLGLVESRATAAEVLDLCGQPAVAARFGFDPDTLKRLGQLAIESGVRWGLSAQHRQRYGLGSLRQNTWMAGLQRMLLGVALSEDRLPVVGTTLPLHDVEDRDLDGLGGLAELLARLGLFAAASAAPTTLAGWVQRLQQAVDDFTLTKGDTAWQRTDAQARLAELAERGAGDAVLSLADLNALAVDEFERGSARSTFGNGALTVCSLRSLRGVPYRVICLIGLDDGVFPARGERDGDDLMLREPRPGEPDPVAEDRQALADAVGAARQALVVVHQGRSALSNEKVPPPAALADLLDVLAEGGVMPRQHPLQPFSPHLFGAGGAEPVSYDPSGLRGARALLGPRREVRTDTVLPPAGPLTEVTLDDLIALASDPVRHYLRVRCDLSLGEPEEPGEEVPIELDGLAQWAVGDRMLRLAREGHSRDDAVRAEWLRGQVPPGELGNRLLAGIATTVGRIMGNLPVPAGVPVVHHDLVIDCGPVRLTGRVSTQQDVIVDATYSKLSAKHRLGSWLRLIALTAATGQSWRAAVVARSWTLRLRGPEPEMARVLLDRWVRLYRLGLDTPLPVPAQFGARLAELLADGKDPFGELTDLGKAYRTWGDETWPMFYPTVDDLLSVGIGSDDLDQPGETVLACAAARLIWQPLTDHEVR
ncbi:exodeoxyribonuclease V subunit gamma [Micropruina sp.]|uniref:exodeoxyribonuclease V subunit gamma n=1 Tax=Micropruina sp. TaxID=2737536 RepID=UPI0039E52879